MKAIDSLAASALLGTARRAPEWPAVAGAVGESLAKIERDHLEKAALRAAGVIAVCDLAGRNLASGDGVGEPAPEDTGLRSLDMHLQARLDDICEAGPARLQAEAMQRVSISGFAWPARLMPKALDCGRRDTALRPFVMRAAGARGAWLGRQNATWKYATGVAEAGLEEKTWHEGTHEQRIAALSSVRLRDPALARAWLDEALPTEGARERAALVACLSARLSNEDEDLLEKLLKDKSKEVRQNSLDLLSSLPESRLAARMTARIGACLQSSKKFLRSVTFTLTPPEAFAAEWKEDLIEETPPKGSRLGARAWWLRQIARNVPLGWWERTLSMKPVELIEWARATDWKDALLGAWGEAEMLQRHPSWAEAFLISAPPEIAHLPFQDLLAVLPTAAREEQALALIRRSSNATPLPMTLGYLLQSLPLGELLSEKASREVLVLLRTAVATSTYDAWLKTQLIEFAVALPPSLLAEAAQGWPAEATPSVSETIARLLTVLDHRRELHRLKPVLPTSQESRRS